MASATSKSSLEFGQTGLNGLSHCLESTYGLRSIIPGHHPVSSPDQNPIDISDCLLRNSL